MRNLNKPRVALITDTERKFFCSYGNSGADVIQAAMDGLHACGLPAGDRYRWSCFNDERKTKKIDV